MVVLGALIEAFYPKKGNGPPPMLRIHFLQQLFGYSDPAMREAVHDVPLLRQFADLDAFKDVMLHEVPFDGVLHARRGCPSRGRPRL